VASNKRTVPTVVIVVDQLDCQEYLGLIIVLLLLLLLLLLRAVEVSSFLNLRLSLSKACPRSGGCGDKSNNGWMDDA
jgi:hypothetical protein